MPRVKKPLEPWEMTPAQLEEELEALIKRQAWLENQPKCDRPSCDGKPHAGAPYPHDPTYRQAADPLESAQQLDEAYAGRPHIQYLSDRLAEAVRAVEAGENRYMTISMPPRMGKSTLTSINLPIWLLRQHPDWKIGLISHSPQLATAWGRQVRRFVEEDGEKWGIKIASDAGAVSEWQTTRGGGIVSRSAPGQSITGLGFKVMLMDDVVKDFADAHSESKREAIWDWWQANAVTRLEPPFLCIAIATRWHEDDFIGRLLNPAKNPDADKWENVIVPAIAEEDDPLGREPGDPLYSPLVEETREEALERWDSLKRSVGSYMWEALYQQHPTPADGSIFNLGWLRFWTTDPSKVKDGDESVILLPRERLERGQWLDSWDLTFKGSSTSDYAVGQRWCRQGPDRFLISQQPRRLVRPPAARRGRRQRYSGHRRAAQEGRRHQADQAAVVQGGPGAGRDAGDRVRERLPPSPVGPRQRVGERAHLRDAGVPVGPARRPGGCTEHGPARPARRRSGVPVRTPGYDSARCERSLSGGSNSPLLTACIS